MNDWLDVSTLVMCMADVVLDSINPQDADGDEVAEMSGALKTTKGDIDPLLPEDERERRTGGLGGLSMYGRAAVLVVSLSINHL